MNVILRVVYDGTTYDLDIDQNIPLRVDISKVDNSKIGAVYGVGSQTFDLPGSKKNNKFFKHAYNVGADDVPAFYNTIDAYVIYQGETLLEGELQLNEVVTGQDGYVTYKVQVYDTSVQFNTAIQGLNIKDADWSAYNHTFNKEAILQSWSGSLLNGDIFYPIVDYGFDNPDQAGTTYPRVQLDAISSSAQPLNLAQFQPAIRLKDTLDVIFDQVGFTYTGSFQNIPNFNSIYILPKPDDDLGIGSGTQNTAQAIITGSQNIPAPQFSSDIVTTTIPFNTEVSDPGANYNPSTYQYTIPVTGDYEFSTSITYERDYGADTVVTERLRLISGSTILNQFVIPNVDRNDDLIASMSVSYQGSFNAGDTIEAQLRLQGISGTDYPLSDYILSGSDLGGNTSFNCDSAPVDFDGSTVDFSEQWEPLTKTLDVLKGIIDLFNLVIIPVPGSKTQLEIHTFDDWFNSGTQVNWNDKWDTSIRRSLTHPVADQPKKLLFQNVEDEDRLSKLALDSDPNYQYGTLEVIAGNTISQGEETVGSYFGPTVLASETTGVNLTLSDSTFVFPHLYKFENSEQQSYKFKPRIGYKASNGLQSNIFIGDPSSSTEVSESYFTLSNTETINGITANTQNLLFNSTYTSYVPGSFNQTNSKSQFTTYWKTYIDSLYWDEGRKVTLDVKFEQNEYRNIQLNDIIFIKDTQYRINKIKGFNLTDDDVATVELLKLYPAYVNRQAVVTPPAGSLTPTPSPSIGTSVTPTPTISVTPTLTPTPTPTISVSLTPGVSVTPTPTISISSTPAVTVTPTPTISVTPTVTPTGTPVFTKIWLHATQGNGDGTNPPTVACAGPTPNAAYIDPTIANVAALQVGDTIYNNTARTSAWNGGLLWYGATDIQGSFIVNYSFYIDALGVIQAIYNCLASPTPTVTPTNSNPPFTNITIQDCNNPGTTYDVRVNGNYTTTGLALKLTGGGTGGCPTFTGGKCWEILSVGNPTYNCTATVSSTSSSCGGCTPAASPTPTPSTSQTTPTPTPTISVSPSQVTPTPTPTVSPSTNYNEYTISNCGTAGGGYSDVRVPVGSGVGPGDVVLMPDGCYQIDDAPIGSSANDYISSYIDCSACEAANPTPTPTPTISITPTPTISVSPGTTPSVTPTISVTKSPPACIAIEVGYSTGLYNGCCSPPDNFGIKYFDANSVATATRLYDDFTCSSLESGTIYVSEDQSVYYEFFNGVKTSGPTSCPTCP